MKIFLIFLLSITAIASRAQSLQKMPDSVRKALDAHNGLNKPAATPVAAKTVVITEDTIKARLVRLALSNPQMDISDANVAIAEIARKRANSTILSSVYLGANVNEFVINNSPAASFYPKYNVGLQMPLDLLAKTKAEKKTADQMIKINKSQKEVLEAKLKSDVLILYENFREKREQLELQKIANADDVAAYQKAQQDFKDETISIDELNKAYKTSVEGRSFLATRQKDFAIATLQLEEIIGVPVDSVLK